MAKKYPTIGLALGSGGAKGLAHIGVLRSLEKHHIPINYIAAASIGSIMGAHYARYRDVKKLEDLIMQLDRKKGMDLLDFTIRGGFVKGKKTEQFISEILENAEFRDLQIPLTIVATDFNTAESVSFTEGKLTKAIRASIAVPPIYQPLFYGNRLLADGGLSNPVPVSIVSQMGAAITIAVNLDHVYVENPLTNLPPLSRVPMHAVNILRHNLALHAVKNADVSITPLNKHQIGLIGWNSFFKNEKAVQIIKEGEEAADKMIPEIVRLIEQYQKRQSLTQRFLTFIKIKKQK